MSLLIVHVPDTDVEAASDWLWSLGAVAIEERSSSSELVAGFADADQALAVRSVIGERWPTRFEEPPDEAEWRDVWLHHLEPVSVGPLVIHPPWREPRPELDQTALSIDPGRAFGSGHHESTQLAIRALVEIVDATPGASVLDVGCGTGVLSVVAAARGASSVLGVDLDLDIAELARTNAEANGFEPPDVRFSDDDVADIDTTFDVVVANMTLGTVTPLLAAIHDRVDHRLILSGLLLEQVDMVAEMLTSTPLATWTDGAWIAAAWHAPAA